MCKKIIAVFLCCLIILSISACNKDETPPTTSPVEAITYDATAYILDSWKDTSGESNMYITSIILYSKDFYDCPDENDVKILVDGNYKNLIDAVEDSEIIVYTMNENLHSGIYTHMKIKSPRLLDNKKIFVNLEGPVEYVEGIKTSEDYQETNGSLDGWVGLLVQLSDRTCPSAADMCAMVDSFNYGVIELVNEDRDQFYYESNNATPIIEGSSMLTKIFVDTLTNPNIDQIANYNNIEQIPNQIINDGKVANIVDGKLVIVDIDKRLEIYSCVEDGELFVGFKTVDGSDFSAYDGVVPDAIVYDMIEGCTQSFVVK